MELKGKIEVLNQTQEISTSFRKRDVVVKTNEQYPQYITVQFVQDKCDILNDYKVGQDVVIGINLRGRSWINQQSETVYFNTIEGWKISKEHQETLSKMAQPFEPAKSFTDNEPIDLPF